MNAVGTMAFEPGLGFSIAQTLMLSGRRHQVPVLSLIRISEA
jgi:hypothetical protein